MTLLLNSQTQQSTLCSVQSVRWHERLQQRTLRQGQQCFNSLLFSPQFIQLLASAELKCCLSKNWSSSKKSDRINLLYTTFPDVGFSNRLYCSMDISSIIKSCKQPRFSNSVFSLKFCRQNAKKNKYMHRKQRHQMQFPMKIPANGQQDGKNARLMLTAAGKGIF